VLQDGLVHHSDSGSHTHPSATPTGSYKNRQIHSGYGNIPPADFESLFYMQDEADIVAEARATRLQ